MGVGVHVHMCLCVVGWVEYLWDSVYMGLSCYEPVTIQEPHSIQ